MKHVCHFCDFITAVTFYNELHFSVHGDHLPNKITNVLSKNAKKWNLLCHQAKSTKTNLQNR